MSDKEQTAATKPARKKRKASKFVLLRPVAGPIVNDGVYQGFEQLGQAETVADAVEALKNLPDADGNYVIACIRRTLTIKTEQVRTVKVLKP